MTNLFPVEYRLSAAPVAEAVAALRAGPTTKRIGGYAAVFNKDAVIGGRFIESIHPRAFNQAEGRGFPGLVALYNHDNNFLLGTTKAGTLRARTDGIGLAYDVDMPEGYPELLDLVRRGDVSKSSFSFRCFGTNGDSIEWDPNANMPRRTVLAAHLYDVSPVNTPAYDETSVGLVASIARHKGADPADVLAAVEADDLRRFFVRTDVPALSLADARAALAKLGGKRPAPDPGSTLTVTQARSILDELRGRRHG